MSIVEPLGIRLFGVEIKEAQLKAVSRALKETAIEYPLGWHTPAEKIDKIAEIILKFGDLAIEEEEKLLDSRPETLKDLFSRSGAEDHASFLKTFLQNIAKRNVLVRMLADLSVVSIETGSVSIRFRNKAGKIEELKINLKKIWAKVRQRSEEIKNSFRHFAEFAIGKVEETVIHFGIYGAAFVLVVFALWYGMAHSIVSGLSTIALSVVNSLKACFPILSFIVWLLCTLIQIAGGYSIAKNAYDAIKQLLAK